MGNGADRMKGQCGDIEGRDMKGWRIEQSVSKPFYDKISMMHDA